MYHVYVLHGRGTEGFPNACSDSRCPPHIAKRDVRMTCSDGRWPHRVAMNAVRMTCSDSRLAPHGAMHAVQKPCNFSLSADRGAPQCHAIARAQPTHMASTWLDSAGRYSSYMFKERICYAIPLIHTLLPGTKILCTVLDRIHGISDLLTELITSERASFLVLIAFPKVKVNFLALIAFIAVIVLFRAGRHRELSNGNVSVIVLLLFCLGCTCLHILRFVLDHGLGLVGRKYGLRSFETAVAMMCPELAKTCSDRRSPYSDERCAHDM